MTQRQTDDQHLIETQITTDTVYDGAFLTIKRDSVRLPDGKTATREYTTHPGAVMVIPLFEDGQVLMERQYRYPLRRVMTELPAGKLDEAEGGLACGKRELLEETGYHAERWDYLTRIHPVISYSTEFIDIWLARDLRLGEQKLDDGEFLDVFKMPATELLQWVRDGRITDVKSVIGAFWLEKILSGVWQPNERSPLR
ncbi:NUDIX domain-containing protein [Pandoraea sp. PE-S2T-3]|uniref:NUDIX domain-containing protein n=1 Tax=Pandoraea sp. PE-S2T-3 TaxID=1986993 RepID=UPI000B4026C0|nr:NUDIX hydrolase [Pandoraea sp. PE-S2T-3]